MDEKKKKEIIGAIDTIKSQILGTLDQFANEEKGNRLSNFSLIALKAMQTEELNRLKVMVEGLLNKE